MQLFHAPHASTALPCCAMQKAKMLRPLSDAQSLQGQLPWSNLPVGKTSISFLVHTSTCKEVMAAQERASVGWRWCCCRMARLMQSSAIALDVHWTWCGVAQKSFRRLDWSNNRRQWHGTLSRVWHRAAHKGHPQKLPQVNGAIIGDGIASLTELGIESSTALDDGSTLGKSVGGPALGGPGLGSEVGAAGASPQPLLQTLDQLVSSLAGQSSELAPSTNSHQQSAIVSCPSA